MKKISLSKVAGLHYTTLTKIDLLYIYFPEPTFQEHPLWETPMNDCFRDSKNFFLMEVISFELISKSFNFSLTNA